VRRPDELIVAFELPPLVDVQWFRKVGTRAAQAISKVVMAVVGGERPRIAVGSVGPTVIRCTKTEAALAGGASFEEASHILETEVQPIDDIRSTASYRRRVCGNLLRRFGADTGR
jgi:xanthine dehydrogenase small subunit